MPKNKFYTKRIIYIYIYCPDWINSKKATISSINKKDKNCFQYTITIRLNHEQIIKDSRKITKIKPSIDKYNWERISHRSAK